MWGMTLNGVDNQIYRIIISTSLGSWKELKLHITLDQPNPNNQPTATREVLVVSQERYKTTEHKAIPTRTRGTMIYIKQTLESLTPNIRIANTTWLSSTTEQDTLKLQLSTQQHCNQSLRRYSPHIELEQSRELTADRHLIPERLQSFLKRRDFTIIGRLKASWRSFTTRSRLRTFKLEIVAWKCWQITVQHLP